MTRSALLRVATLLPASILLPASATEGNRPDRGANAGYAQQPALEGKGYGKSEMDYSDFEANEGHGITPATGTTCQWQPYGEGLDVGARKSMNIVCQIWQGHVNHIRT